MSTRVKYVKYTVEDNENARLKLKAPLSAVDNDDFSVTFEYADNLDDALILESVNFDLKRYCSTIESATELIEMWLKSWYINIDLRLGRKSLRLRYNSSTDIDVETGEEILVTTVRVEMNITSVRHVINIPAFPDKCVPDDIYLDAMFYKYSVMAGNDNYLTSLANYCLSCFDASAQERSIIPNLVRNSKRRMASRMYKINYDRLNRVGDLCKEKGGSKLSRDATGINKELTNEDKKFLRNMIESMILARRDYILRKYS